MANVWPEPSVTAVFVRHALRERSQAATVQRVVPIVPQERPATLARQCAFLALVDITVVRQRPHVFPCLQGLTR